MFIAKAIFSKDYFVYAAIALTVFAIFFGNGVGVSFSVFLVFAGGIAKLPQSGASGIKIQSVAINEASELSLSNDFDLAPSLGPESALSGSMGVPSHT